MDLFDLLKICARRWYVFLPVALLASAYAHHVYTSAKPVYYSNAIVGLAAPNSKAWPAPNQPAAQNGLLEVGGPAMVANLTIMGLRDPATVAAVVAGGGSPWYTAKMFPVPMNTPGLPLIFIETSQPDPMRATKTMELVVAQADPALRMVQERASVPPDQFVKAIIGTPPTKPQAAMPSRTKSAISIVVAGIAFSMIAALISELLLNRWKSKRNQRSSVQLRSSSAPAPRSDDGASGNFTAGSEVGNSRGSGDELILAEPLIEKASR